MDFIKPKNANKERVSWRISNRTKLIIDYYAKYTGYEVDEIVDIFMKNALKDEDFIKWLKNRRSKKKINEIIFGISDNEQAIGDDVETEEDDF